MKSIIIVLGFLLISLQLTNAQELEWAQRARERGPSPAAKAAYDKAVADQAAKKKRAEQENLKDKESWDKFDEEQAELAAQHEAEEDARQKECGDDYGQIKVGMRLSRIQKCVGEFYLRGQVKTKNGVVEHYTRDGTYLYVKGGRIVAWGG